MRTVYDLISRYKNDVELISYEIINQLNPDKNMILSLILESILYYNKDSIESLSEYLEGNSVTDDNLEELIYQWLDMLVIKVESVNIEEIVNNRGIIETLTDDEIWHLAYINDVNFDNYISDDLGITINALLTALVAMGKQELIASITEIAR